MLLMNLRTQIGRRILAEPRNIIGVAGDISKRPVDRAYRAEFIASQIGCVER